jgi:hypothetical protein
VSTPAGTSIVVGVSDARFELVHVLCALTDAVDMVSPIIARAMVAINRAPSYRWPTTGQDDQDDQDKAEQVDHLTHIHAALRGERRCG